MSNRTGVIGARCQLGRCVIQGLLDQGETVTAYSRTQWQYPDNRVESRCLSNDQDVNDTISLWISVAPIWGIADHFDLLIRHQAQKVLLLSSTSRWTKNQSSNPQEQAIVQRLVSSEEQFQRWAEQHSIHWTILRPTLIYGYGQDKNITEILKIIKRFRFFPVFGSGTGLRQPIHMDDVANACIKALLTEKTNGQSYNIAGAETLSYRQLIQRLFEISGQQSRIICIPLVLFQAIIPILRSFPRYQHWNSAMVERMNSNLVFDSTPAQQDFAFKPGKFVLKKADM